MELSILGIDIAKNVFHFHGVDSLGREVFRKKVYRGDVSRELSKLKSCRVVMESCGGAQYWCREAERAGHVSQLIAPQYVTPFVKRNKNDWKDAEAICEAAQRPQMRYVPRRSECQQDIQNLHRVRERLVKSRTALVNEMRGLLMEYGIVLPQGRRVFASRFLDEFSKHTSRLSALCQETFYDLYSEYHELEERIKRYEIKLKKISKDNPDCARLMTIPGVGFLTATAMVAAIGDISVFKNGRELAAWLGLTPREYSTGGKQRLYGISKRGDKYLRKLLVHGARVTLRFLAKKKDSRSVWATDLKKRKGMNRTSVALANKNARTIWALLTHSEQYQEYEALPLAA